MDNQGGEEHQLGPSDQFLRRLSMNLRGEEPSRSVHKRAKFERGPDGHFGYVAQNTAEPRIVVPRPCTRLHEGTTKLIVTNMSPHKSLHNAKGKQVAFFRKANRDDKDMYALDLDKSGTSDKAFVDLASICEQRDALCAAHPLEPCTNRRPMICQSDLVCACFRVPNRANRVTPLCLLNRVLLSPRPRLSVH